MLSAGATDDTHTHTHTLTHTAAAADVIRSYSKVKVYADDDERVLRKTSQLALTLARVTLRL